MRKIAVIGLRNYGSDFANTRHNLGERFLRYFMNQMESEGWKSSSKYEWSETMVGTCKLYAILPKSYMNLSSSGVVACMKNLGLKPEDLWVVHDDVETEFAKLRFKDCGSANGHNGVKDIIRSIGFNFRRIRLGIGKNNNLYSYVLSKFSEEEINILENCFEDWYNAVQQKISYCCNCTGEE
ncbi:MAG: aminoacyl-tRNA hydrolase [Chlamydiia bacterium]|nr:aminoacyl-tRNA hydrolase [Chlamydiia bacterium]